MNLQYKFGNCITTQTLNIELYMKAGRTDRQTNGQTNDPNTTISRQTFQVGGHKKIIVQRGIINLTNSIKLTLKLLINII